MMRENSGAVCAAANTTKPVRQLSIIEMIGARQAEQTRGGDCCLGEDLEASPAFADGDYISVISRPQSQAAETGFDIVRRSVELAVMSHEEATFAISVRRKHEAQITESKESRES